MIGLRRWLLSHLARWLAAAREHEQQQILARCAKAGTRVRLRPPVMIYYPEKLSVGNQVDVGEFTHIRANGGVTIGDRVLIASHVVITSGAHPIAPPRWARTEEAPITIEDDVWIGAGAIILPGVTVGRGAVVAAGAVVSRAVEPMTVVAGVPAKAIRRISESTDKDLAPSTDTSGVQG